jgi:hypothetical protein
MNKVFFWRANRGINWRNLMDWCYHVWKREQRPFPWSDHPGQLGAVVQAATEIAVNSRGSWGACERQLKAFRVVAGKVDAAWLDDSDAFT